MTFTVRRCVYYIANGVADLDAVATNFDNTDGLALWALNPLYERNAVTEGQVVNVGHLLSPSMGDTLTSIAAEYKTSVQKIIDLNADLDSVSAQANIAGWGSNADVSANQPAAVGAAVCILP